MKQVEQSKNKESVKKSDIIVNNNTQINLKSLSKKAKLSVYDMYGHLYYTQIIDEHTDMIYTDSPLQTGIYIIKIENEQSDESIKVFIP